MIDLLTHISLYRPESDTEWDKHDEAIHELEECFRGLDCLVDLETRSFADFVAGWANDYAYIGASDTACRESIYLAAERYLSLRELLQECEYSQDRNKSVDMKFAMENVKSYFNLD